MDKLGNIAQDYFSKSYSSDELSRRIFDYGPFEKRVSDDQNHQLTRMASLEEIKAAAFEFNPYKSLGPDGMTSRSYQQFWIALEPSVVSMIETFFRDSKFDKDINNTNICLIPKHQQAKHLKDYRPIRLCNVGYKIIAKILTKCLKSIMPQLISETQSAFVSGQITDNILVVRELIHSLKTRKQNSEEFIAVKTDMTKAYDRIEWRFLEDVMHSLGFSQKWISLIMECVSTVRYKVLLNGDDIW